MKVRINSFTSSCIENVDKCIFSRELIHTAMENLDAGPETDDRGRRLRIKVTIDTIALTPVEDVESITVKNNSLHTGHWMITKRDWSEGVEGLERVWRVRVCELRSGKQFGPDACAVFTDKSEAMKYRKQRVRTITNRLTKKYGRRQVP